MRGRRRPTCHLLRRDVGGTLGCREGFTPEQTEISQWPNSPLLSTLRDRAHRSCVPGAQGQPGPSATENFHVKKLSLKNNIFLIQ